MLLDLTANLYSDIIHDIPTAVLVGICHDDWICGDIFLFRDDMVVTVHYRWPGTVSNRLVCGTCSIFKNLLLY